MDWYKQAIGIQLTPFQERLARIDQILTEKDWKTVASKAAQSPYDIEKLVTDIYRFLSESAPRLGAGVNREHFSLPKEEFSSTI